MSSAAANTQLIEGFYAAFGRRDGDAMAACYAPGATFSDPVFPDLSDGEPGAMWRMLTSRADDLEIELVEHEGSEQSGTAHWLADYTFAQTGRKVHNDVRASFRFEDGSIADHRDDFNFHAWARQALGPPGLLLGWTPLLRGATRRRARAQLEAFMGSKQPRSPG